MPPARVCPAHAKQPAARQVRRFSLYYIGTRSKAGLSFPFRFQEVPSSGSWKLPWSGGALGSLGPYPYLHPIVTDYGIHKHTIGTYPFGKNQMGHGRGGARPSPLAAVSGRWQHRQSRPCFSGAIKPTFLPLSPLASARAFCPRWRIISLHHQQRKAVRNQKKGCPWHPPWGPRYVPMMPIFATHGLSSLDAQSRSRLNVGFRTTEICLEDFARGRIQT